MKINIKPFVILIPLFLWGLDVSAQTDKTIPSDFCISASDNKLYESINQFLIENNQKELSFSKSLSYVAKLHITDLLQNHPDTSICNLSSWSDKGKWKGCCYNKYVPLQDCMWDKPKELTNFKYRGYEIAMFFEESYNADSVMQLLLSSNQVINMLLSKNDYSKKKWVCMGLALNQNYASIWFAQRADKAGKPQLCDTTKAVVPEITSKRRQNYYIIVASFSDVKDAKEALKRLKQNGYNNAGILKSDGNVRVYLDKLELLKEAMYFKQKLPYTYSDAWIFKE